MQNKPIGPTEGPSRPEDIARKLPGLVSRNPHEIGMCRLEKTVLIVSLLASVAFGTICALKPTQYEVIKQLPVAAYVIRPGDTFYGLSERFVKDQDKYGKQTITGAVADMNSGKDPANLRPGDVVYLPVDGMSGAEVAELGGILAGK